MAISYRRAERFLVCLHESAEVDGVIQVTELFFCVDALVRARTWVGDGLLCRRAEVWCGAYLLFDSDDVLDFDLAARFRAQRAPAAPGRYVAQFNDDGSEYSFVLVKS